MPAAHARTHAAARRVTRMGADYIYVADLV